MASELFRWIFETPDPDIGWLPGALAASLRLVHRERIDVVYSTSPPYTSHLTGVLIKLLTRLPLVLDFRDPWARGLWNTPAGGSLRDRAQSRLESFCVRHADRVILNTEALQSEFRASYRREDPDKFRYLPNGYDPADRLEADRLRKPRAANRSAPRLRLCHPGNVYGARQLGGLLAAMAELAGEGHDVHLLQMGIMGSRQSADLQRRFTDPTLRARVRIEGRQSHSSALRGMAGSDVLVVLQPDAPLQVPGKFYEILMFRKPVLALTHAGATADLVRSYRVGEVAAPDSPAEIAAAIRRLRQTPPDPTAWDEALARHDGRALTEQLARILGDAVALAR